MNKYQDAHAQIIIATHWGTNYGNNIVEELDTLKELVDKTVPVKPFFIDNQRRAYRKRFGKNSRYDGICPICGHHVFPGYKYCSECAQALDWGDDE